MIRTQIRECGAHRASIRLALCRVCLCAGVSIPSIAPSGAYQVDLTFSDQNGMPLTCLQVNFSL